MTSISLRLQKVLADAGVGSRRECEELITEGRVDVDGQVITQLGSKVDPESQAIRVDGFPLKRKKRRYFAVHKPPGIISTSKDQWRRARVIDLVDSKDRVFTIGRLDKESSGLILVTNDGELANQLTHPRYGVKKTYQVTVAGVPNAEVLQKLRHGVTLSDGRVKPESLLIKKRLKQSAILEIVLTEGRNREIRRMLARFDHKVMKLRRVAIGPVRLGNLPLGAHRELTRSELSGLRAVARGEVKPAKKKRRSRKSAGTSKKSVSGRDRDGAVAKKRKKAKRKTMAPKTGTVIGGNSEAASNAPPKKKNRRSKKPNRSGR